MLDKLKETIGNRGSVEEVKYRFVDDFYHKNRVIGEYLNYDNIEFNRRLWILDHMDFGFRDYFRLEDLFGIHSGLEQSVLEFYYDEIEDESKPLVDLLNDEQIKHVDGLIKSYVKDMSASKLESVANEVFLAGKNFNELDVIKAWTVYFSPWYYCEETAFKCGLLPFRFKGEPFLALGGGGMDYSPKLDAYQALVIEAISSGSHLVRNEDYFKNVVGDELTDEVIELVTLDNPKYIVRRYR